MADSVERKCVLLMSPLKQFCGNTVHANRLQRAIENGGYKCLLHDPSKLSPNELLGVISDNKVEICVGIHALHSGKLLIDCPVPFGIILSGTDVNGSYTAEEDLRIMDTTVEKARFGLCLTQGGVDTAKNTWPQVSGKVSVIKLGISINPSSFSFANYCRQNDVNIPLNPILFTLVCGIRPVKDPIFGLLAFAEFCSTYAKDQAKKFILVIIGPNLDHKYFLKFQAAIKGKENIIYIPGLPLGDVHAVMKESFLVLNTSVAEGCPHAIMEACLLHVPVMVRNNHGNTGLITDHVTGLVFDTIKDFAGGAWLLWTDEKSRKEMVANAHEMITRKHSIEQESRTICEQINHALGDGDAR